MANKTEGNLVNRIGKLYIPEMVLRNSIMFDDLYQLIMEKLGFIVLRCEFLRISNQFEYQGYSPYFRKIELGTNPPAYDLILTLITNEETQNSYYENIYIIERQTDNKIEIYSRKEEILKVTKNHVSLIRDDENEK